MRDVTTRDVVGGDVAGGDVAMRDVAGGDIATRDATGGDVMGGDFATRDVAGGDATASRGVDGGGRRHCGRREMCCENKIIYVQICCWQGDIMCMRRHIEEAPTYGPLHFIV